MRFLGTFGRPLNLEIPCEKCTQLNTDYMYLNYMNALLQIQHVDYLPFYMVCRCTLQSLDFCLSPHKSWLSRSFATAIAPHASCMGQTHSCKKIILILISKIRHYLIDLNIWWDLDDLFTALGRSRLMMPGWGQFQWVRLGWNGSSCTWFACGR